MIYSQYRIQNHIRRHQNLGEATPTTIFAAVKILSGHKLKQLVHYLILMGIPLLGVVVVLQLGSSLKAPVSVGGDWQLVISGNSGCYLAHALSEASVLRIAQSGPELRLRLSAKPPINLAARLDGLVLRAANTPDETIQELNAVIRTESEPDRLEGEITANGCAAPLLFSATRMPETETLLQSH